MGALQSHEGRAPATPVLPGGAEVLDGGVPAKDRFDGAFQDADPLAVDDPHVVDAPGEALLDIIGAEVLDLGRFEGVKIQDSVYFQCANLGSSQAYTMGVFQA